MPAKLRIKDTRDRKHRKLTRKDVHEIAGAVGSPVNPLAPSNEPKRWLVTREP